MGGGRRVEDRAVEDGNGKAEDARGRMTEATCSMTGAGCKGALLSQSLPLFF